VSHTHSRLVVKSSRTIAVLFLCTVPCVSQTRAKQPQPGSKQTALKEVLSWLPDDTETVIGANGPFPVPDLDTQAGKDTQQTELPATELELQMRAFPLGLFGFKNGGLQTDLKGKSVSLAVEGSRHFRPPTALGEMRYEGCEIVVFGPATPLDHNSFMKNAANSAIRFEKIRGVSVAVFQEQQENDVWTTFVAFPRSNIVLVATDANYLRAILARMSGASGPRALPETLPEWKYVNTQAPAWGMRHYQKLAEGLDPTSPFQGQHAANIPDSLAVGLAFWFQPAARKMATLTYLSANRDASQILQNYLSMADANAASPREFQIRIRQAAPDVVEGSVTFTLTEALHRFLFGLFAMLGHAVYV
jgi:hypothetical protein